jgi:phospholipase/carboxylesterase
MTDEQRPERLEIDGWPFRVQKPGSKPVSEAVLLLLHGHLGDENVMWILTNPLPKSYWMLAPRAPVPTGKDAYSWHEIGQTWPGLDHYQKLARELIGRVDQWKNQADISFDDLYLMGFSQGAVMAYALAILYPQRVKKVAALASFLPREWEGELKSKHLKHQSFFVAHGTKDTIIPIEKARRAASTLKEKGAEVTFCDAETGHKLSANCFNGLGDFFGNSTVR